MEIRVTGSSVTAALPEGTRRETRPLRSAGRRQTTALRHAILREDVPVVREVLAMWQQIGGVQDGNDELHDLRSKLARLPGRGLETPR
jgi:hypothetical protein